VLACNVEGELRSGALVQVLADWECVGGRLPIVAVYRKTRPTLPRVNAFVRHLEQAFKGYNNVVPVPAQAAVVPASRTR
jgi:DNA-binding transcriptional LysR family regulator